MRDYRPGKQIVYSTTAQVNIYLTNVLKLFKLRIIIITKKVNKIHLLLFQHFIVVFHFNETCCVEGGMPEACMGLCRERLDERVEVIMPENQCDEYKGVIRSCLNSESGRKLIHNGQYNERNIR